MAGGAPAPDPRRNRGRPPAAAFRRGFRPAAHHGASAGRCRPARRVAPATGAGRVGRRVRCPASVHPHRRATRGQRGDHGRVGRAAPDATAAAGRGRFRQDRGGPAGDAGGDRLRRAGGLAGAHRGAGRPASAHHHRATRRPGRRRSARRRPEHRRRVDHGLDAGGGAAIGDRARRIGRSRDRHRNPRPARLGGDFRRARPGRGRRAAPLRRGATGRPERQGGREKEPDRTCW